ncbi:MAG: hypothetical protein COU40_02520 [Candidatus Moranbacteria bacterium CG10_big_fil_rev_8_21_14_0_10_35_21]|nr:MAG: hypothetical protein COU40_02520 [Candidatus Moranbacteria bacterium CG10_big_fil_rev_8_21_14_0_10_35_21]
MKLRAIFFVLQNMSMEIITIENVLKSMRVTVTSQREALIRKAYDFALAAHHGQKRKSGEEYIQHSLRTALNLANMGMRSRTIAAGLLHDVPEDTSVTLDEIEKNFGKEIAFLISGITKLGKIKLRETKEELYLENLRKMFLAMASDIRVVIIKLADRLNNMETLDALSEEKQRRIALETMEVYAPIANRLGIGDMKDKLEDLSFKYLDKENYEKTQKLKEEALGKSKKFIILATTEIKKELKKSGIKVVDVFGRTKHLYSLYQKLKRYDMDIAKVYDLYGVRIIVPEVADCYEALGIVHKKYHPLIGRIKDYISLPKPNGYQSIHTTVFGPDGLIMEVQIRTQKMDIESEFGIAAHWIYSDHRKDWKDFFFKKAKPIPEEELIWVKQLREWQSELGKDNQEFVESLKIDFFKNHIFAFTPMGDIIDLPEEATPIDFAYKVHSQIGHRAVGAKVDKRIVPLDYKIKNGEVVEIITSKETKNPSRDWLRFVRTSMSKSAIRKTLKKNDLLN